jgi:predicted DCC family thiol-disulfide oxidoreductase YuxK
MQDNAPLSQMLEEVDANAVEPNWQVKYLYDGDCPVCQSVKAFLSTADGAKGRINFVDISSG